MTFLDMALVYVVCRCAEASLKTTLLRWGRGGRAARDDEALL